MLRRVALVTWTVISRQTDPVASPTSSFDLRSQIWPLPSFLVLNSEPKIFQNLHTAGFIGGLLPWEPPPPEGCPLGADPHVCGPAHGWRVAYALPRLSQVLGVPVGCSGGSPS